MKRLNDEPVHVIIGTAEIMPNRDKFKSFIISGRWERT
jgi:hypothetical protein